MFTMDKKIDFTNLEKHIENEIATNRVAGISVLVYKDGQRLLDKCYGYANIEKGYKITPDTRFRLASMTKPITAVAAMIAQEQGLFKLDDYAYKYLPIIKDRKLQDKDLNTIDEGPYNFTIRQLLNHSAGFAGNAHEAGCHHKCCHDENLHKLEDFIKDTKDMGVYFVPGTKFAYSGSFAYNLVARIIEIQSGMQYIDFLKKYIFDPLGMTRTSYLFVKGEEKDKAISYKSIDGKLVYFEDLERGFELYYPGFNSGGAGLISTKEDYFRFALMLLNRGELDGHRIMTRG